MSLESAKRAGTYDRDDANQFDPACVCKGAKFAGTSCSTNDNRMADWDEWWLDLHSETCKANIHNVMAARIKSAKEKGCDGVDPDNVDSVSEPHLMCSHPSYRPSFKRVDQKPLLMDGNVS